MTEKDKAKNPAPNLDTLPGNEQKPPSMPEKTMVREINPQQGNPPIPSRAPEVDPGNSLDVERSRTASDDKEAVRKATAERAQANTKDTQENKPNPNTARSLPETDMERAFDFVLPNPNATIPPDEQGAVHPQANTIELSMPAAIPPTRVDLSKLIHSSVSDVAERNRNVASSENLSARGRAVDELMTIMNRSGKLYIKRMLQVQLVLRNTSMDTQQQEKVLRQIGEIFADVSPAPTAVEEPVKHSDQPVHPH